MARKILSFLSIIFVLGACSPQGTDEKTSLDRNNSDKILEMTGTAFYITFEKIETAIKEQGLELVEADLPSENAFIQSLNGVSPKAFFLDGKTLSIYVFSTVDAREKGMADFEEKTATMELETHKTYTRNNILVFYTDESDGNNSKLKFAIKALD